MHYGKLAEGIKCSLCWKLGHRVSVFLCMCVNAEQLPTSTLFGQTSLCMRLISLNLKWCPFTTNEDDAYNVQRAKEPQGRGEIKFAFTPQRSKLRRNRLQSRKLILSRLL